MDFTSHTIEYLNRVLAPCVTRHGVLLDIYGEGVMITGDSGIGKSESAIELIKGATARRDDVVEIRRLQPADRHRPGGDSATTSSSWHGVIDAAARSA